MPYIEKKFRFPILETARGDLLRCVITATEHAEILENVLVEECVAEEKWDGIINYVLSKLLLSQSSLSSHDLSMIFYRVYIQIFEEHGYFGRERFLGLLHCMRSEFQRRGWEKLGFLREQERLYERVLAAYEAVKLEENGDII